MFCPYFLAFSRICDASSLVGVRIRTSHLPFLGRDLMPDKNVSNGRRNAAVFPVPVCAIPIASLPSSSTGIISAWIGEGAS